MPASPTLFCIAMDLMYDMLLLTFIMNLMIHDPNVIVEAHMSLLASSTEINIPPAFEAPAASLEPKAKRARTLGLGE